MDLATLLVMSMYAVLRTPLLVSLLSGTLLSTYYCLVALSYLFCYVSLCNLEIGLPQFHPLSRLLPIYCTESRTITNTLQLCNISKGIRTQGKITPHICIRSVPEPHVNQNMGIVWIFCSNDLDVFSLWLWVCRKRQGLACKTKTEEGTKVPKQGKGKKSPVNRVGK